MKNLSDPQLLPKSFKNDGGTDFLCRGLDIGVAPGGMNETNFLGESGQGPDDGFDIAACAKLIQPLEYGSSVEEIEIYMHSNAIDVWHEFIHATQHSGIDLSEYPYPLIKSRRFRDQHIQ